MQRKKIRYSTDQRPFVMVYQDFLKYKDLTCDQKMIFICLKSFANSKNQCFPSIRALSAMSGISERTVNTIIKELVNKGFIKKEAQKRPDGGRSTNLYTLYDYAEIWDVEKDKVIDKENDVDIIKKGDISAMIKIIEENGYTVKEKESKSHDSDSSTNIQNSYVYNKSKQKKSQERYSLDKIKDYYEYNLLIEREPLYKKEIDIVMNILYDVLNSTKSTIRVKGEDKPTMVVVGNMMRLTNESIMYAIHKFESCDTRIKNPIGYMRSILYSANEQYPLDMINRTQSDN